MVGPSSSYSFLLIHMVWKLCRDARMEPPSHTEYFRSSGAFTYTFWSPALPKICPYNRSLNPSSSVFPPLKMMLA